MGSDHAYAVVLDRRSRERGLSRKLVALRSRDSDVLLAIAVAIVGIALLELLPHAVLQDTWLALLSGREVAQSGIPHHDVLTSFTAGRPWIDQQWLSQLLLFEAYRLGGVALAGVFGMALLATGVAGAVVAARRLGASPGSIIRVLPLALFNILVASEVRTQAFVYPLLAGLLYLLARDSRQPSPRVYWCLPLLIVWGNLHGSAAVGAGLVVLRALTILWERRSELGRPRTWLAPAILGLGAPLCLLVTPYGFSTFSYYDATLLNGTFRQFATEWQPLSAAPLPVIVVFLVLAGGAVFSFGRFADRTTLWDRCALLALAFAAIMVVRNVEWFGIAALMLLPVSIDPAVRRRAGASRSHSGINLAIATAVSVGLIAVLAATLAKPAASFEAGYPSGALSTVRTVLRTQPGIRVYADERFADWLLWAIPRLRGRVAYDARFELLSSPQRRSIADLKLQMGPNWQPAVRGYRVLVLPAAAHSLVAAFTREPETRALFSDRSAVVLLTSAANTPPSSSPT